MTTQYADPVTDLEQANMAVARRFIEAFNRNDWDSVRAVIAAGFVFHHPLGGTVQAGPEGMVETWASFKKISPDSWHPIPVMIAERDHVATLLPTYGTYRGDSPMELPATGRLDYGMVNILRLEDGKIVEAWFGMDPLVEMQQMGMAPAPPRRPLSRSAKLNLEAFFRAEAVAETDYDTVAAFDDAVVAMGPPQDAKNTMSRWIEVHQPGVPLPELIYSHEFVTNPPYPGNPEIAKEFSRSVVGRWFDQVLNGHSRLAVESLAFEHLLIHPTAMPCEGGFYGVDGAIDWLDKHWAAFGDLTVRSDFSIAHGEFVAVRWSARGISQGGFMGQPPTGKVVQFGGISMYRIEQAKIAEIWETRNTFAILRQLNPDIGVVATH